jgi:hypothetical protein
MFGGVMPLGEEVPEVYVPPCLTDAINDLVDGLGLRVVAAGLCQKGNNGNGRGR